MAITGTRAENSTGNRNWFVNECVIKEAEQVESAYNDCSIRLKLEDKNNGYNYTLFVNQNYEKDNNGVVTGLLFPEDLNTLFLATKKDMNVSDIGEVNVNELIEGEIACINYSSTGKYKRSTWGVVSSLDKQNELQNRFKAQLNKGYPKNYKAQTESNVDKLFNGKATTVAPVDDLPF